MELIRAWEKRRNSKDEKNVSAVKVKTEKKNRVQS